MGLADARIIDLEEEKAQLEEAKAAAEAASKEAFALREKQTERIKRTKAGGPGGESAVDLLPLWSYALEPGVSYSSSSVCMRPLSCFIQMSIVGLD